MYLCLLSVTGNKKLIKFLNKYEYFWFRMNVTSFCNTCEYIIFFKNINVYG